MRLICNATPVMFRRAIQEISVLVLLTPAIGPRPLTVGGIYEYWPLLWLIACRLGGEFDQRGSAALVTGSHYRDDCCLVIGLIGDRQGCGIAERTAAALLKYLPLLCWLFPLPASYSAMPGLRRDALSDWVGLVGSLLVAVPVCGWAIQWLAAPPGERDARAC